MTHTLLSDPALLFALLLLALRRRFLRLLQVRGQLAIHVGHQFLAPGTSLARVVLGHIHHDALLLTLRLQIAVQPFRRSAGEAAAAEGYDDWRFRDLLPFCTAIRPRCRSMIVLDQGTSHSGHPLLSADEGIELEPPMERGFRFGPFSLEKEMPHPPHLL